MSIFSSIARVLFFAAMLIAVPISNAFAVNYPSKPIKIIVPGPVGSPGDLRTREIAALLAQQLGKPVVVENKPGAGSTIGTSFAARATPDGYTLLYTFNGPMAMAPHLVKEPGYDALNDFAPIIRLGSQAMLLVVPASSPHADVRSLVAAARAQPGKLLYGSSGIGSVGFLPAETFKRAAGKIDVVHVPYKGDNEVVQDLVSARINWSFSTMTAALPQVRAGKLRALAVTNNERLSVLPEVPTMKEAGYPDLEWTNWAGFVAPAGTPPAIVERLFREISTAASNPQFKARQETQLVTLNLDGPEKFAAWIKREHARIGALVREIGLQPQ